MSASILKHTATVTYDDAQVDVDDMVDALNQVGLTVEGEPQYLK